jgi:hypothetical protein
VRDWSRSRTSKVSNVSIGFFNSLQRERGPYTVPPCGPTRRGFPCLIPTAPYHDHEFLDAEFVCRGKTEASAGGGRIFTLSLASRTRHDADRSHAYSRTPDTCVRPRSIQGQIKEIDRCIVHSCGSLYSTHQPWIRLQTPLLRASQPAVPIAIPIAFWGQRGFWACTGASQTLPASFRA